MERQLEETELNKASLRKSLEEVCSNGWQNDLRVSKISKIIEGQFFHEVKAWEATVFSIARVSDSIYRPLRKELSLSLSASHFNLNLCQIELGRRDLVRTRRSKPAV